MGATGKTFAVPHMSTDSYRWYRFYERPPVRQIRPPHKKHTRNKILLSSLKKQNEVCDHFVNLYKPAVVCGFIGLGSVRPGEKNTYT